MAADDRPGIAEPARLRPAIALSAVSAVLMAAAAIPGIFTAGFYRDTASIVATNRGSDLLALFVAVPVLCVSLVYAARGSLRAQIVWLGVTGWATYNYAVYAYGLNFTPVFLAHVAILALSLFTLVIAVRRVDADRLDLQFGAVPRRLVAGYLLVIAVLFAAIWLGDIVPAIIGGGIPKRLADLHTTSNPVEVNDLAVIIPLLITAAVGTWRRRPLGYLLAGALLGVATWTMAAILPGGPLFAGSPVDPVFSGVAVASLAVLVLVLQATHPLARPSYEPDSATMRTAG